VADPESEAKSLIRAGQALQAGEDIDGAIRAYSGALVLRTSDRVRAYAFVCRGSAKDEAWDFDGAVADYDEAIALVPDDPSAWFMRGIAYQVRKNGSPRSTISTPPSNATPKARSSTRRGDFRASAWRIGAERARIWRVPSSWPLSA